MVVKKLVVLFIAILLSGCDDISDAKAKSIQIQRAGAVEDVKAFNHALTMCFDSGGLQRVDAWTSHIKVTCISGVEATITTH